MAEMEDSTEFKPAVYDQHHTKPEPSSQMWLLKGDGKDLRLLPCTNRQLSDSGEDLLCVLIVALSYRKV